MGRLVLFAILGVTGVTAIFRPWVGVVVGYLFAIFGPQFIWFWAFEGIRPFYVVAVPTMVGFVLGVVTGRVNISRWKHPINLCVAGIWVSMVASYYLGPYVDVYSEFRFFDPEAVFTSLNKMFLFYFLCVAVIDSDKKVIALASVILITVVYMTYWANMQYLDGRYIGRLKGPIGLHGSLYRDENTFAMLFVTGLPFVYYAGYLLKNRILRLGLWLIIPFGWHAVFLTGSRGGLVGLGVTVAVAAWRSPRRWTGLMLIPALAIAYVWQGGSVMKQRATTITEYREESSARTRLEAWEAALGMILAHPVTGVGVASFGPAFPDFSEKQPRVAHNTFLQVAAEWGVLAGVLYIVVVCGGIIYLIKQQKVEERAISAMFISREALLVSLSGFLVCSMFLSLQGFEVLYYLLGLVSSMRRQPESMVLFQEKCDVVA